MFGEIINILPSACVALLLFFLAQKTADCGRRFKIKGKLFFSLCLVLSLFFVSGTAWADDGIFSELTEKGAEIFTGMRDIVYVVAGFGIIGVAVGGFFGNLNWKSLSAIIIGLVVLAVTGAFVKYVTGEEIQNITDTLK